MTIMKVNNRPAFRNFDGLVNELFGNFEPIAGRSNTTNVPVNITENDEAFQLEFSAPGRNKENFKIKVENNQLVVSYEEKTQTEVNEQKEVAEQKQVRREFTRSSFQRSFTLNEKVNTENIEAKYEDGILKVLVPKKEEVKPIVKEITIG